MNKEEFTFASGDGRTKIHAVRWLPAQKPKAILQISHGMVEFIDRYDGFANFLTKQGLLVTGNDHLGHGASIGSPEDFGFFADGDGAQVVLEDLHRLTRITKEAYPQIPYFLLGHSMGSFFARRYLCCFGQELDGAIIMGTGNQTRLQAGMGMLLTTLLARFHGWRYRSNFIDRMAFGGYNAKFEPARTEKDWLTKDAEIVDAYLADPRCTFLFTLNAYYSLFHMISLLHQKAFLSQIPKNLPVLFLAGAEDPVGNFGKGVKQVAETFRKLGVRQVQCKLYPNDRHEILNELDREAIYEDIACWLEDHR